MLRMVLVALAVDMHNSTTLYNDPIERLRHALNILGHGDMTLRTRVRLMLRLRIKLLTRWG